MRCYFFLRQAVTVTCFRKNKKVTKTGRVFMTPFSRVSDTLLCHPAYFFEDFRFGFLVFQSTPFSVNDICPNCKIQYSAGTVSNQLTVTMRRHIKEYYMVGLSNFEILFFAKCQFLSLSLTCYALFSRVGRNVMTRPVVTSHVRYPWPVIGVLLRAQHAVGPSYMLWWVSVNAAPVLQDMSVYLCYVAVRFWNFLVTKCHAMDFPGT